MSRTGHGRSRTFLSGLVATVLFGLLFVWIGGVSRLDLNLPLEYTGDSIETLAYNVRAPIANDFDTRLRAPFEIEQPQSSRRLYNALFQSDSNLMWLVHALSDSMVGTLNLYYLATFLLAFLIAYAVSASLGLSRIYSFCAASLYALMPYHFQRSVHHLWESSYYLTPAMVLIILRLWTAYPAKPDEAPGRVPSLQGRELLLAALFTLFLSSFHPYHQFFFAVLLASAAPIAALQSGSRRPLIVGWALSLLAVGTLALKTAVLNHIAAPELALTMNGQALGGYGGAEIFPLKLAQMLLPTQGHRWHVLASVRAIYDAANPLNNENSSTALGMVGGLGLVICVAAALALPARQREGILYKLGLLVLICMLFACMGGISSLISTASYVLMGEKFPLTQTRAWNRIVVFVAFASYFSAFWALHQLTAKLSGKMRNQLLRNAAPIVFCAGIFGFALWDQVPNGIAQYSPNHFESDVAFFSEVEKELPAGSKVFQFPFVIHHASGFVRPDVYYTDAIRPYVASRSLHFTYGGDQGSEQANWLDGASHLPAEQLPAFLCRFGFSAALIHRNMLENPAETERNWAQTLGVPPRISNDQQMSLFPLIGYCQEHAIQPIDMRSYKQRLLVEREQGIRQIPVGALPHHIGRLQADDHGEIDLIGAAPEQGALAFGPYEELQRGAYAVTFSMVETGRDADEPIVLDVVGKRGNQDIVLAREEVRDAASNIERILRFELDRTTDQMQYRVIKPHGLELRLRDIRIERLKPADSAMKVLPKPLPAPAG
jgi:phosphoglycerol transferase